MKAVIEQGTEGMDADARRKFKHALAAFTANLQSSPVSNADSPDSDED